MLQISFPHSQSLNVYQHITGPILPVCQPRSDKVLANNLWYWYQQLPYGIPEFSFPVVPLRPRGQASQVVAVKPARPELPRTRGYG